MLKKLIIVSAFVGVAAIFTMSLYFGLNPSLLSVFASTPSTGIRQPLAFALLKLTSPNPNRDGGDGSPLQYALTSYENAETEQEKETAREVVEYFLSRGGDLNRPDRQGLTPVHNAVLELSGTGSYMRFLLEHGADPNVKAGPGPFYGQRPLAFATRMKHAAEQNSHRNPNYVPNRYQTVIHLLQSAKAHE